MTFIYDSKNSECKQAQYWKFLHNLSISQYNRRMRLFRALYGKCPMDGFSVTEMRLRWS